MGLCNGANCCKDEELLKTNEFNPPFSAENGCNLETNNFDYSLKSKYKIPIYNINDENIKMEEEIFNNINDIKINPDNFINESKNYNLFEIFLKLKPSNPFKQTEFDNLNAIKTYLFRNIFQDKVVSMQEKELLVIFPEDSIKNISLFQKIAVKDDNKENVWQFLEENEDDIEKILTNSYEYLIVICQPMENKTKTMISFIFYNK